MGKPAEKRTVRLTVDITVKVEDWMLAFDVERRDVPWDVREYFFGLIRDSQLFSSGEIEGEVQLKN